MASVSFEKVEKAYGTTKVIHGVGFDICLMSLCRVTVASGTETILTHEGRHGDGHPLRPLVWLANFLASRDQGLEAGQIVTTGSYAGVLELPLATPLDIRFGDLGTLSVQFIGMV